MSSLTFHFRTSKPNTILVSSSLKEISQKYTSKTLTWWEKSWRTRTVHLRVTHFSGWGNRKKECASLFGMHPLRSQCAVEAHYVLELRIKSGQISKLGNIFFLFNIFPFQVCGSSLHFPLESSIPLLFSKHKSLNIYPRNLLINLFHSLTLEQCSPTFLAPGTGFWKMIFPWSGVRGMVWGWFKCITFILHCISILWQSQDHLGLIPGLGRCPGEGSSHPLQDSGLENSMDCIVHGVAKNRTRLSDFHFTFTFRMFCLDFRVGIPAPVRIQCHRWFRRRRNSAALQMIRLPVSTHKPCLLAALLLLCGLVSHRVGTPALEEIEIFVQKYFL